MGGQSTNKLIAEHGAAFVTILIWSTMLISTKVLLRAFSPIEVLFIRFPIGYLALWLTFPHRLRAEEKRQELYFVMAGLCGVTLYYPFGNIALTYTLASNVRVIISAAPFFTMICSRLFLHKKRPGERFFVGLLTAMAEIGLISFDSNASLQLNPLEDILALVAAVIRAVYSAITRKVSEFGYGAVQTTRRTFFYGFLFVIPVLFTINLQVSPGIFYDRTIVLNLLFLGLGASAIYFATWSFAVKILGTMKTTVYTYMMSVITTVTSVLILHERISWPVVCGTVLALTGLFLSKNRKQEDVAAGDGVNGSGSAEVSEVPGI